MLSYTGEIQIGANADENLLVFKDEMLVRKVPRCPVDNRWDGTAALMRSEIMHELMEQGLVPQHTLIDQSKRYDIYQVEIVKYATRPMEWASRQVIEILSTICKISNALKDTGYCLTEPVMWNFTFQHTRPILMDIGAIDRKQSRRRFVISYMHENVDTYLQGGKQLINELEGMDVDSIDWLGLSDKFQDLTISEPRSNWDNYEHSHTMEQHLLKKQIDELPIESIVDVCGHNGKFLNAIAASVPEQIVIDNTRSAINDSFVSNSTRTSAVVDITALGPADKYRYCLDANWVQRFRADAVVFSSAMHHLLRQGMDLDVLCKRLLDLSNKYVLFEYIAPTDPHVRGWYDEGITEEVVLEKFGCKLISTLREYEPGPERDHRSWLILER